MYLPNRKAVSTLALIILMVISTIIGGLVSYMFTIAAFTNIPKGATVTITNIYLDKENASSFRIGVLNPSYSPANATITRIAISVKGESQLYNIIETDPPIEDGIVIPPAKSLNVTCFTVHKDGANMTWGGIAGEFGGETITVHLFSSDAPAESKEATLPIVKLSITGTNFDSKVSFRNFTITLTNSNSSEIDLTIKEIMVPGIELKENDTSPVLPQLIAINQSITFECNGDWHGLRNTTSIVSTKEGYVFFKVFQLPEVYAAISKVTFDEDHTDHFNVTILNSEESANHINVTKIVGTIENGAIIQGDYLSVGIAPNSTQTFKLDWAWKEYRGRNINVTAYLLQDFEASTIVKTPSPIIVKVLNEEDVFDLRDSEHFNITLQNHPSSLEPINITQIVSKEPGGLVEVRNGTRSDPPLPFGPIGPGQNVTFCCDIAKWTGAVGLNLTITVHTLTNVTLGNYTFEFVFTLPFAKLNVTDVLHTTLVGREYLTITVENSFFSVRNLTISKIKVMVENQTKPLEQTLPENQTIAKPGDIVVLLFAFNWSEHPDTSIIVTVITAEGIEASRTYQIP